MIQQHSEPGLMDVLPSHSPPSDARDRSDVANKIVIQLFVEGGIDRNGGGADQKQGITIWYCPRDRLNGDIACSTGSIFDDKLLTKPLRQPLGYCIVITTK